MCVGGVFVGTSAVEATVVIGSHRWADWTVARNVCRFVWGTTSNVHVVAAVVAGSPPASPGFTSIVTVPCQVPARNDGVPDGSEGLRPQAAEHSTASTHTGDHARRVIPRLLHTCVRWISQPGRRSDRCGHRTRAL